MSAPTKFRVRNVSLKPVCNHCVNVNKRNKESGIKSEFPINHWLRETPSPNSPVVCPLLLATVCRFCRKTGHTKSMCKALHRRRDLRHVDLPEKSPEHVEQFTEPSKVPASYKSVLRDEPRSTSPMEPPPIVASYKDAFPVRWADYTSDD